MAPHLTSAATPTSATATEAATPASPPEPGMWTVGYYWEGEMESIHVSPAAKGSDVRRLLARKLGVPLKSTTLLLLRQADGTWPSEDEAATATGKKMAYLMPVAGQLEDANAVQIRVVGASATPADVLSLDSTGYDSSTPSGAAVVVNDLLNRCRKRKADTVAYSSVDEEFENAPRKRVARALYEQRAEQLPDKFVSQLKQQYTDLVNTAQTPWTQSESQRRLYINSMLITCMAAVIEKQKHKRGVLKLSTEHRIYDEEIDGNGRADYVISMGERMVTVILAKKCDMQAAQSQNFAAMEVARVLNGRGHAEDPQWHNIQGICTDFQNWIFVKRTSLSLVTDHHVVRTPESMKPRQPANAFPPDLIDIANMV